MRQAAEHDVHRSEIDRACALIPQVGAGRDLTSVSLGRYEPQIEVRMPSEQPDEFLPGVPGPAQYSGRFRLFIHFMCIIIREKAWRVNALRHFSSSWRAGDVRGGVGPNSERRMRGDGEANGRRSERPPGYSGGGRR